MLSGDPAVPHCGPLPSTSPITITRTGNFPSPQGGCTELQAIATKAAPQSGPKFVGNKCWVWLYMPVRPGGHHYENSMERPRVNMGLQVRRYRGLSWHQSESYLECAPNPPIAHHPPLASAEPTGVHLGAPPTGLQDHTCGTMFWGPQHQEKPVSHSLGLQYVQTMSPMQSMQVILLNKSNPSRLREQPLSTI